MISREEFQRFYSSDLQPLVAQTEAQRKSVAAFNKVRLLGYAGAVVLGFILFAAGGEQGAIVVPFLIAGIFTWVYSSKKKAFAGVFKQTVITRIIRFISPDSTYQPSGYVNENEYTNSGLYQKDYDDYTGEDFFQGKDDKTAFFCSELHTQYKTRDSKGRTTYHTIFRGLFFVADFNKNFSGRTYVWPNNDGEVSSTMIGKLFSSFSRSVERVELESPDFEHFFDVYGTDQVEARYILSPSLMERLMNLRQKMDCSLRCSFIDTKLYMAFETRTDLFEPGILQSNESLDAAWNYVQQFGLFFDIIDEMNLNTRIWTKQ